MAAAAGQEVGKLTGDLVEEPRAKKARESEGSNYVERGDRCDSCGITIETNEVALYQHRLHFTSPSDACDFV